MILLSIGSPLRNFAKSNRQSGVGKNQELCQLVTENIVNFLKTVEKYRYFCQRLFKQIMTFDNRSQKKIANFVKRMCKKDKIKRKSRVSSNDRGNKS